jgi:hypothetical protein
MKLKEINQVEQKMKMEFLDAVNAAQNALHIKLILSMQNKIS